MRSNLRLALIRVYVAAYMLNGKGGLKLLVRRLTIVIALGLLFLPTPGMALNVRAQANSRTFPETGKTVNGRFLQYWNDHGGLAQQGYPISEPMSEKSQTDGKVYTVQYFERAVFEMHPENPPPNDVLLSLLGAFRYQQKYNGDAPNQSPNQEAGSRFFRETGKRVGGLFLSYWASYGGVAWQGYPISDEFMETSDLNGKPYKVQYFQRAVFEFHPENEHPYQVLLSQLGTYRYSQLYVVRSATPPLARTPATLSAEYTIGVLKSFGLPNGAKSLTTFFSPVK